MMTKVISILLILLYTISFSSAQTDEIELELKFSFPSQELISEDIFFYEIQSFSSDSDGNIYIVSRGDHKILKFNFKGKFITGIGGEGQGPGEFQGPNNVAVWDNKLFVLDNFSRKIQILDANGKYLKGFYFKSCWDIEISNNGLILVSPLLDPRSKDPSLFEVFSQNGKLQFTFGEPIDWNLGPTDNRICYAISNRDDIFVAFKQWPIIHKYSIEGELQAEYPIEHKGMKMHAEFNRKQRLSRSEGGARISRPVIDDIKVLNEKVYLLFNSFTEKKNEIIELNNEMKVTRTYVIRPKESHIFLGLIVNKHDEDIQFYLLQFAPQRKVDVFGIKMN